MLFSYQYPPMALQGVAPRRTSVFARWAAVAATSLMLFTSGAAQALDVHNAYGSYTASISDPQSTAFNTVHFTNGYETELCCFGRDQSRGAPQDRLLVTFVADPGYVFTSMHMGFTGFSLRTNAFEGFINYGGNWNVSTGTFAPGQDSFRYDFIYDHYGWDQSGTGGTFFRSNEFWNSGGVNAFIPIMSATGIDLANASEFTLEIKLGGEAGGSYGTNLNIEAITIPAPVPEPETYVMLLAGLGLLGFATRRRRSR